MSIQIDPARYRHDCPLCHYLGRYRERDLWLHLADDSAKVPDPESSIIMRYGHDGPDYISFPLDLFLSGDLMMPSMQHYHAMSQAVEVAIALDLIQDPNEPEYPPKMVEGDLAPRPGPTHRPDRCDWCRAPLHGVLGVYKHICGQHRRFCSLSCMELIENSVLTRTAEENKAALRQRIAELEQQAESREKEINHLLDKYVKSSGGW